MGSATDDVRRRASQQDHQISIRINPLLLLLIIVAAIVAVRAAGFVGVRASGALPEPQSDSLARLSAELSVQPGRGNLGAISTTDERGRPIQRPVGAPKRLERTRVRSLSLPVWDFDEDGVPDLIWSYSRPKPPEVHSRRSRNRHESFPQN